MRHWVFLAAFLVAAPLGAQDEAVKKKPPAAKKTQPAKKPAAKKAAHQKPTPEQIRKYNELEKKQKQ